MKYKALLAILQGLPFAVECRAQDGRLLAMNPARWQLHGYDEAAFKALSASDYLLGNAAQDYAACLARLAAGESVAALELAALRKDGSRFLLELSGYLVSPAGEPFLLLVLRDVTAAASSRAALEELRLRNQLILDCAGEGIYGLDAQGRTSFVNRAAARMTGWQPEQLLGRLNHDVVHHTRTDGSVYPRHECPIYAAFNDGVVHTVDSEVFWRQDGSSFAVEYTSTPIIDEHNELTGAVVSFRDITQRKANEEKLLQTLAENERLKAQLEDENVFLREELKRSDGHDDIIGQSPVVRKLLTDVTQVADTETTTLILGETGTGKELIAAAIHHHSRRRDKVLVKINCAALPPSLIESELFGHEKGAFSGATQTRIGRFERADGGTLFLDEIGELPLELQGKLLRVLQEGELERLGANTTLRVDVRIIAATNRDLAAAVAAGEFREDLYYRLNVFPLRVPPLRERTGDIALLAQAFVRRSAALMGKDVQSISRRSLLALERYSWPGNVRELQNVIERAMVLSAGPKLVIEALESPPTAHQSWSRLTLDEVQRRHIIEVLDQHNWVVHGAGRAAEVLGLNPSTLRSRMKKLGIEKPRLHSRAR